MPLFVLLPALTAGVFAQPGPRPGGPPGAPQGSITGQVYDADLAVPIEYANIVLYRQRDSSLVTGAVTGVDGRFRLTGVPPGRFYIDVSFIGYQTRRIEDVQLAPGAQANLGRTLLRQAVVAVKGAEATAERPTLEYKIDKKVIDVGRVATAISGTAVDVLENVPSVKVDVEGNVSLRGSQNFTVLIDGKPSPIEGSEALQQIPATTIDKIEIITNPSAKYDPEGVSGIINVILKKQRQAGLSGTAGADGGWPGRYGGNVLVNYRLGRLALFGGADYRQFQFPGSRSAESWTRYGDTTWWTMSSGDGSRNSGSWSVRGGGDYQLTDRDRTSLSFRYGDHSFGMNQNAGYERWTVPGTDTAFQTSRDSSLSGGYFLNASLDYQHKFGREGHQLAASASYARRGGTDRSTNLLLAGDSVVSGRHEEESGPRGPTQFKLDYSLPLGAEDKLEAGYQGSFHLARSENRVSEFVPALDSFEFRPQYSQAVDYTDQVHALYAQYGGKLKKLGFQPGLRVEHADRLVDADSGRYSFNRWDYFPTLHLSYDIAGGQQAMASYTRRIERPRGWELWPFLSWRDPYTVSRGNPDLRPELTSAFEAGWQLPLGGGRVSADAYYRLTSDKIEHVRSVYEPGVILFTVANVGADYALGLEGTLDLSPLKWWTVTASGDLYDYRVTGELLGQSFDSKSFNWDSRLENEFRLPTNTKLQVNVSYESPTVEAQGREGGRLRTDLALRQQFFNRQLAATLQVRDLLGTGRFESTAEGDNFYSHFRFTRRSPMMSLNLTWNFNNYKPERRPGDNGGEEMDNGGSGEY